jgi:hypothetical protein
MTANPLKARFDGHSDRPIAPKGDSEADKAARIRFWIDRGNALLWEAARHDVEWVWRNGSYSIEPRQAA